MDLPDIATQRAFYDRIWEDVGADELNTHEQARLAAITAAIGTVPLQDNPTVLEVGAGRGWLSGKVLRRVGDVTAYDLSPASIAKAREAFPDVTFEARDVMLNPPQGAYDLVVSSEVIEHIDDQRQFAESLIAAVKPGGHIVLTTPNAKLKQHWETRGPGYVPQPIENWLTRAELRRLFEPQCAVLRSETFFVQTGQPLTSNPVARMLRHRTDALDKVFGRADRGLYQVLAVRRER